MDIKDLTIRHLAARIANDAVADANTRAQLDMLLDENKSKDEQQQIPIEDGE